MNLIILTNNQSLQERSLNPGLAQPNGSRAGGCTNLQFGHERVALHIITSMWHRMHTVATISGWLVEF